MAFTTHGNDQAASPHGNITPQQTQHSSHGGTNEVDPKPVIPNIEPTGPTRLGLPPDRKPPTPPTTQMRQNINTGTQMRPAASASTVLSGQPLLSDDAEEDLDMMFAKTRELQASSHRVATPMRSSAPRHNTPTSNASKETLKDAAALMNDEETTRRYNSRSKSTSRPPSGVRTASAPYTLNARDRARQANSRRVPHRADKRSYSQDAQHDEASTASVEMDEAITASVETDEDVDMDSADEVAGTLAEGDASETVIDATSRVRTRSRATRHPQRSDQVADHPQEHSESDAWDARKYEYENAARELPPIDPNEEVLDDEENLVARVQECSLGGILTPVGPASGPPEDADDEASGSPEGTNAPLSNPDPEVETYRAQAMRMYPNEVDEVDQGMEELQWPLDHDDEDRWNVAKVLVKDLLSGHGCGDRTHRVDAYVHSRTFEDKGVSHNSISKTYNNKKPLERPTMAKTPGLHNRLPIESVGETAIPGMRPGSIQKDLEGREGLGQNTPRHICIHKDHSANTWGQHSWDVDSWIALPNSFKALNIALQCQRYSKVPKILTTDLHIKTPAKGKNDEWGQRPPRTIAHLFLGKLYKEDHVEVYIFFPSMDLGDRPFNGLTEADRALFFDKVLWPSVDFNPDDNHHTTQSFESAKMKSMARGREANNTGNVGSATVETAPLKVAALVDTDGAMAEKIAGDHLLDKFKDFYLFINAKGIKLMNKHHHSLYHNLEAFDDKIRSILDLSAVRELYFDIGKEFTHTTPETLQPFDAQPPDSRNHVFLHRTCCLMSTKQQFKEAMFGNYNGVAEKWTASFLRDVSSLTLCPPKKSKAYRVGLRYSQWYNVYKEVFDAQKIFPFQHKQFLQLAKGKVVQTLVAEGSGGNGKIAAGLSASYQHSRLRVAHSLGEKPISYGARLEHRVSLPLWNEIMAQAKVMHDRECNCGGQGSDGDNEESSEGDGRESPASDRSDLRQRSQQNKTPSSLWAIPTIKYMEFLAGNYDKIIRAYEIGIRTADVYVSQDRCKVLWVLLLALTHFQSANLKRPSTLWIDEKESKASRMNRRNPNNAGRGELRSGAARGPEEYGFSDDEAEQGMMHGLGLESTIEKYGYGWFLGRIDWDEWRILPAYDNTFLAFFASIQKGVGGGENAARDTFDKITMYGKLLREFRYNQDAVSRLAECMCHAVYRQYRYDVVQHFSKGTSAPKNQDSLEKDDIRFSWDGIRSGFVGSHMQCTSPALTAKQQSHIILWLFGGDGKQPSQLIIGNQLKTLCRTKFGQAAFRQAYILTRRQIRKSIDPDLFDKGFRQLFFHHHWVVPYPDVGGALSGTEKKEKNYARRWWVAAGNHEYVETGLPRSGYPPDPPEMTAWGEDELRQSFLSAGLR